MRNLFACLLHTSAVLLLSTGLAAQQPAARSSTEHPRDAEIHDADTRAWWHTTEHLAGDDMEGRDTGTAAYQRAADYVAARFKAAGLAPAGDGQTYFQSVEMHQVTIAADSRTSLTIRRTDGTTMALKFLEQVTANAAAEMPPIDAALTFRGYCGKEAMLGITGKAVLCFGTQRQGLPTGAERVANAKAGGAAALINIDDPSFTIEPPRWPYAYARTVSLGPAMPPHAGQPTAPVVLRLNAAVLTSVLENSGQDAATILKVGGSKEPLKSFDIPAKLEATFFTEQKASIKSPNILAVLPGSDPMLKNQYVVIAAHLDGYGFGTPVNGDALYNGALDDAAYVALLIQYAEDLQQQHRTPKRSILFCAFTGEEKGLLGASYFVEHPTVPVTGLAADINLDQLRPLFPLNILTASAVDDTTLGQTARQVGSAMHIEIRADHEPERNLLHRADNYPFLRIGVPAISFIFGYDAGTDAERRYREWYQVRYHRPQDDLTQPMDFDAAAKFDAFFYALTNSVADQPERPAFLPGSSLAPPAQAKKKTAP